jgi:hypothetical protein
MPIIFAPHLGGDHAPLLLIAPGAIDPLSRWAQGNTADLAAKTIAWFGVNPLDGGKSGAWVGGGLWVGGTNAGNAPIFFDAYGHLTIVGGAIFSGDAGGSVRINNYNAPGGPVPLDVEGKIRSSTGYRVGSTNGATGNVTFTGTANGVAGIIQLNFAGGLITGTEIVG